MGWICPECGYVNAEDVAVCTCGFDQSVFLSSNTVEAELADEIEIDIHSIDDAPSAGNTSHAVRSAPSSAKQAVAEKSGSRRSSFHPSDLVTVKEVGSWRFSLSQSDGRISISTAALEPFRLDLSVGDLEDILEAVYKLTNNRKTLRRLELMDKDVLELVEFIGEMIDDKRSKIRPSFSHEDVGVISSLLNGKLSQ